MENKYPNWISVADRTPELGQQVITCTRNESVAGGHFYTYEVAIRGPHSFRGWVKERLDVDYWMPLPEGPE